jgi:hypothetical protein
MPVRKVKAGRRRGKVYPIKAAMMKIIAIAVGLFLAFALIAALLPARAEIPGDGRPIALYGCLTRLDADVFVELLSAGPTGLEIAEQLALLGPTCRPLKPFYPADLETSDKISVLAGPLTDWEGDEYAVFEFKTSSGRPVPVVFIFVWYHEGYPSTPEGRTQVPWWDAQSARKGRKC